jgi:hypothetical protein
MTFVPNAKSACVASTPESMTITEKSPAPETGIPPLRSVNGASARSVRTRLERALDSSCNKAGRSTRSNAHSDCCKRANLRDGHRLRDHSQSRESLTARNADAAQNIQMTVVQTVVGVKGDDHHSDARIIESEVN